VLIPLCLRWQAQWNLSTYRKKLIASGEKLSLSEIAPKKSLQATNTALFLKLISALPERWVYAPAAMWSIKPGVARVVWRQPRIMERMGHNKAAIDVWPIFTDAVRTNEPALGQAQALLDAGGIEFVQDITQPDFGEQSFLTKMMDMVSDSGGSVILALHEGRMQEAYHDLKSSGAVLELAAKDTTMDEQLARYAIMTTEFAYFWEALQAGGWTDEQLAQWQHQWEQTEILAGAEATLDLERLRGMMLFVAARSSRQELGRDSGVRNNDEIWNDFLLNARTSVNDLLDSYPRYWRWRWIWSYREEKRYLEIMQTLIVATRDAQKRRSILSFLEERKASGTKSASVSTDFDVLGSMIFLNTKVADFIIGALCTQTEANMVTAAIALERFRLAHHAYPDALAKLVPEFVQAVPIDCMDGHDLRYHLNADGSYLLYSIGEDGVDNGGAPTPKEGKMLYLFYGRDWVWPRPATAEEMQAYEAEQSKRATRK